MKIVAFVTTVAARRFQKLVNFCMEKEKISSDLRAQEGYWSTSTFLNLDKVPPLTGPSDPIVAPDNYSLMIVNGNLVPRT